MKLDNWPPKELLATATQSQPAQAGVFTWPDGSVWNVPAPTPPPRKSRLTEVQENGKRFYRMVTS